MPGLTDQVQKNIESRGLFKAGQRILVAVSGGVDSMVLLDVLNRLRDDKGWRITVAHLNHRLRGRSSDADERLVRRVAKQRDLAMAVGRVDVRNIAARGKLSIEMAARKARHEFLARVAQERGIPSIAVAHHADDQVELFFLRLFRGAGGDGLSGMKWRNPSPACSTIELARPLLDIPKAALVEYALENKVPFREDATNRSFDMQRNRIRHELLPLIRKKYQPALGDIVLRVAEIVSAEAEHVTDAARRWLKLQDLEFPRLPVAVQRRVLLLQLMRRGIAAPYQMIERLRLKPGEAVCLGEASNLKLQASEKLQTSNSKTKGIGLMVLRNADGMVVLRERLPDEFLAGRKAFSLLAGKREIDFGGARITWRLMPLKGAKLPRFKPGCELFDADKVGSEIVLRHWKPGDRFQPIGMAKSVKLQDLLVNQKVPKETRRGLIIATTGAGELFWVEKLRISERFRLSAGTKRRLQWCWQRL